MAYRLINPSEKVTPYVFRAIEVVAVKKPDSAGSRESATVVLVDNHLESLKFVEENMHDVVKNVLKVRKMNSRSRRIDENAKLFESNLKQLFAVISEKTGQSLLDKLSHSLKKALILMAMERYDCDKDRICSIFGISRDALDKEMDSCGLI